MDKFNNMQKVEQKRILDNKNDLIEGTFCFELFEKGLFNKDKCVQLTIDIAYLKERNMLNPELLSVLEWIILSVDQCFTSNKDLDDFYTISNYEQYYEFDWNSKWKKQIQEAILR